MRGYLCGHLYIVIGLLLIQSWPQMLGIYPVCLGHNVQNSARYLCGLRSPIEKGEVVTLFLVMKKMEGTLLNVVKRKRFVEIEGI